MVEFELDMHDLPPLIAEQQAELDNLAMRPGEAIDYTDIPSQDMHLYRPVKEMTRIRPTSIGR